MKIQFKKMTRQSTENQKPVKNTGHASRQTQQKSELIQL